MKKETKEILQWHPAFYAGLQIELLEEADKLIFENEHALSNKPMLIDVLIIKKNSKEPIRKNIGKIFKKYNIVEYKSPDDYLNIDDFYKVHGYACFYKSDTKKVNEIDVKDVTITFVSHGYPREMLQHLMQILNYKVEQQEEGIYYISGDMFSIQLLVTSKLSKEQNLWLKSLTNKIKEKEQIQSIIQEYGKHKNNKLYKAVMNLIVRANEENFKEVNDMCEALEELFKDKIEEKARKVAEELVQEAVQEAVQQGEQQKLMDLIQKKLKKQKTIEQIAEELEETVDTILPFYNQLKEEINL